MTKKAWLPAALIVVVGVWAYHNSLSVPFIYDDLHDIEGNPRLHDLWTSWQSTGGSWRPVAYLSLAVNYQLGGTNPRSYHFFNGLVHLLGALTLYGLVRLTLRRSPRYEHWASALALAVALLWVTHPLQTESVTYIIQRYESLMGLFFLLTMYCLVRGAESATNRLGWHWAALACCALGMGSKEVMVTAPLAALAYDRIFLASSWREVFRERGKLHLGLMGTWAILFMPMRDALKGTAGFAGFQATLPSPLQYALTQLGVLVHYLRISLWPNSLCFDYGWPVAQSVREILPAGVVIAALLAATAWALWRAPRLGFIGLWFFLILAPTSSVMPIADAAVEHRMYLPLAAVILLAVLAGHECLQVLAAWCRLGDKTTTAVGAGVLSLLVGILGVLTIQRNEVYQDSASIWRDSMVKSPRNFRTYNNLATYVAQQGRTEESIELLQEALELNPTSPFVLRNLGAAREKQGRIEEAETLYRRALERFPRFVNAHANLGTLLLRQGKLKEAEEHLQVAVEIDASSWNAHDKLGVVRQKQGRFAEALAHHQQAEQLNPDGADPQDNIGVILWKAGKRREAIDRFRKALELQATHALAHNHLAVAFASQGELAKALEHFGHAVESDPEMGEAHYGRGLVLLEAERPHEALTSFEQAVRAAPRDVRYRVELGGALWRAGRKEEARAQFRESLRLDARWPQATDEAAWRMATSQDPRRRQGRQAVVMAEQVCRATEYDNAKYVDTLAAAYAETGRFDDAVATARMALQRLQHSAEQARLIQGRLELYQKNQPYRE